MYRAAALEAFAADDGTLGERSASEHEDALLERFERFVRGNSITVDRSKIIPGADPVQIPVTDETTIGDLLDSVYFKIATAVHPFTYGSSWVLRDIKGVKLTQMGTRWAGHIRDERSLEEAGIAPGQTLFAEQMAPANEGASQPTVFEV